MHAKWQHRLNGLTGVSGGASLYAYPPVGGRFARVPFRTAHWPNTKGCERVGSRTVTPMSSAAAGSGEKSTYPMDRSLSSAEITSDSAGLTSSDSTGLAASDSAGLAASAPASSAPAGSAGTSPPRRQPDGHASNGHASKRRPTSAARDKTTAMHF